MTRKQIAKGVANIVKQLITNEIGFNLSTVEFKHTGKVQVRIDSKCESLDGSKSSKFFQERFSVDCITHTFTVSGTKRQETYQYIIFNER